MARSEVFFLNYSFVICLFNRLPFPYHPPWDYLPFHHIAYEELGGCVVVRMAIN